MSWGLRDSYVRIKPPYICTYYLYRFLCTGHNCGKRGWVYYYTLRLLRNDCCAAAVVYNYIYCGCIYYIYNIYVQFLRKILYVAAPRRGLSAVYILYLYYIYYIIRTGYTLKYRQLNRYCALRNAHNAACCRWLKERGYIYN